jgi:hypothetical protein
VIYWGKDLGRTIDYLETRKDLNLQKLAFYGVSTGGLLGEHFSGGGTQDQCRRTPERRI